MDGVIILNKPAGMTSHDCVDKVRKILKTKKVGHTGTLDPETTGVLPLCINKATKIVPFLTAEDKEYICKIRIGSSTTTEDFTGDVLEKKEVAINSIENIESVIEQLLNIKEQIPPMYSAVKVNGKKLYEYARQGIEVERKARPIKIHEVKLLSDITYKDGYAEFDFRIRGSKGFYVRTICVTIGEVIGYPAHLAKLHRTKSGTFDIKDSITFDELEKGEFKFISIKDALNFPSIDVDEYEYHRIKNGSVLSNKYNIDKTTMFCRDGELLALYIPHPTKEGMIKPLKVF